MTKAEANGSANGNTHGKVKADANGLTHSAASNKKAKKDFCPSDGIKGRWEGVSRPYTNEQVLIAPAAAGVPLLPLPTPRPQLKPAQCLQVCMLQLSTCQGGLAQVGVLNGSLRVESNETVKRLWKVHNLCPRMHAAAEPAPAWRRWRSCVAPSRWSTRWPM